MTRIEALEILMREAQREGLTKVGLSRVRKAAKTLGLTEDEQRRLEEILEYRNRDGELHSVFSTPQKGKQQ